MKRNFIKLAVIASSIAAGALMAQAQDAPKQLTIFSGPQGGGWYGMAGGLAQIFNEAGSRANAEIGAGISNVVMVSQGRGEIGFSMSIVPGMAASGQEPFQEKITNIRGIAALGNNVVQLLVRADSGVTSVEELKGKAFGSQPVGAVTAVSLAAVLSAYGLTEADLELTRGSQAYGASETKDRRIVGYTVTANPPTPSLTEVAETADIRLLPITDEAFNKLKEVSSGYVRAEIPSGTYRGVNEPVPSASTALILVNNEDMSDDDAYWVTRTLAENIEKIQALHSQFRDITVQDLASVAGVELHPGALRYYKEVGAL